MRKRVVFLLFFTLGLLWVAYAFDKPYMFGWYVFITILVTGLAGVAVVRP